MSSGDETRQGDVRGKGTKIKEIKEARRRKLVRKRK
jgi:hypothetical protein